MAQLARAAIPGARSKVADVTSWAGDYLAAVLRSMMASTNSE